MIGSNESVLMQRELGTKHMVRGYRAVHWPPKHLIQWIMKYVLEDRVHTMMAIIPVLLYGLWSTSRYLIQLI